MSLHHCPARQSPNRLKRRESKQKSGREEVVLSRDSICVRGRQDQMTAAACLILTVRANGTSDEAVSRAPAPFGSSCSKCLIIRTVCAQLWMMSGRYGCVAFRHCWVTNFPCGLRGLGRSSRPGCENSHLDVRGQTYSQQKHSAPGASRIPKHIWKDEERFSESCYSPESKQ